MPTTPLPTFSQVSLEYLRHHDAIEAARDKFLSERGALLEALGARVREGAAEKQLNVVSSSVDEKAGELEVQVAGAYVKRRLEGGDKRSSGFSVRLGSFRGQLGAHTTLWFHMKLSAAKRKALAIDELDAKLGAVAPAVADGMWMYVPLSAQTVDAIDLAALAEAASVLPEKFVVADQWLGQRYVI